MRTLYCSTIGDTDRTRVQLSKITYREGSVKLQSHTTNTTDKHTHSDEAQDNVKFSSEEMFVF